MEAKTPLSDSPVPRLVSNVFGASRWRAAVLIGFIAIYFALQIGSIAHKSATYDEPVHLTAGYAALTSGDHRVDPCHPPFVRMWAALPLLAMPAMTFNSAVIDALSQDQSLPAQNTIAHDFLYSGHNVDRALYGARLMIVVLGALLGILIFCWAEEWLGAPAGVLALGFFLISPNLGAHASLVTTDLGVTCFIFGTVYFLWRTARCFTAWNLAGLAVFFALASTSKFSAVLLIPIGMVLLALAKTTVKGLTWRRIFLTGVVMAATGWVGIWLVYGLRYEPSATPGWIFHSRDVKALEGEVPFLAQVVNWIDAHRLLPNAFSQGFLFNLIFSEQSSGYLAGEISREGWWYYYPLAVAVKTPVVLLGLFVAGLGMLFWRIRSHASAWSAMCLVLPIAIYLGAAMSTGINLGLRHILPVYPFVVMIACVAGWKIATSAGRHRLKLGVLAGLLGVWVISFASVYPNTLTFFNLAVGGPERGGNFLSDSNLDWGQHLKLLKRWMDQRGIKRINLAYFGMADPNYRGISCVMLPGTRDYLARRIGKPELPGYVAISETISSGVYLAPEWRIFYEGFEQLEPVAVIGHTIRVYRIDRWPRPVAATSDQAVIARGMLAERLRSAGWHEHAIAFYRDYLQRWPDDIAIQIYLAQALAAGGDVVAADEAGRRAMELARTRVEMPAQFAGRLISQREFHAAIDPAYTLTQLLPNQPEARDLFGIALAGAGKLAEARKEFEAALRMDPANLVFQRHLGQAIQQLGFTK